ncbi:arsenic resistance protein [Microbacterium sp. P05]|uniref:arsenic resistance protein n=1 Tax=Microbacterium sp. P05 TaxID=3366948 RepID=UPI0037472EF6
MRATVEWTQKHQVALFLLAIAAGGVFGMLAPGPAQRLEVAITPVLGALLYVTFLGVPFRDLGRALRGGRFLVGALVINFVVVPIVVFALSRFVVGDEPVLLGVLLVLLAPCVDYVIVFAGLAGGDRARLLALTPLLLIAQVVLLPGYVWVMAGEQVLAAVDLRPFASAFLWLIIVPLGLAVLTQLAAGRWRAAHRVSGVGLAAMVPLMMLTLAIVVASQVPGVRDSWTDLLVALPLFAVFPFIAAVLGAFGGRLLRLGRPDRIALTFSAATRNSLVVLPLALALPPAYALTPVVVVSQTLVELLAMLVLVAVAPRVFRRTDGQRR